MKPTTPVFALAALVLAGPAFADVLVQDAYARASTPQSVSGAAFMRIENRGAEDDRLIAAATDAAERTELHTHEEDDAGVMRMIHVDEGFAIPAGEARDLDRGGDHVMLLGLTGPLEHGETISLTLTFEQAGEVDVEVPVDLERGADHGHVHGDDHDHDHDHGH